MIIWLVITLIALFEGHASNTYKKFAERPETKLVFINLTRILKET